MATTSNKDFASLTGTFLSTFQDSVTVSYFVEFDSPQSDPYAVFVAAQLASPDPVPLRGEFYPGLPIIARRFSVAVESETRTAWRVAVTYEPQVAGDVEQTPPANPMSWETKYDVEYIEQEYVITSAKNVEVLAHANAGKERAANTPGPIVNAAGKSPISPLVDTERNPILVITKNYSSLSQIVNLNDTYMRTTNSDTPQGFSIRTMKYLLTDSLGKNSYEGTEYWEGRTRIEIKKTTDLILDNEGYVFWDPAAKDPKGAEGNTDGWWVPGTVWDKEEKKHVQSADPVALKLDGSQAGANDQETTITWRHLDAVSYASLVS